MKNWKTLLAELTARDDERRHERLTPFVLLSLLLHVLIFVVSPLFMTAFPLPQEEVVEILPLLEEGDEYRIADIAPPAVQQRPEQAKFVGQYDSTAKEERVASDQPGRTDRGRGEKPGEAKPPASNPLQKKHDLYRVDPDLFARQESRAESGVEEEGGAARNLDDYFPDFRRGEHTYLNVLRFPDVDYFVRMKRAFKLTFNPGPPLRAHFLNNRITRGSVEAVLGLSVNAQGELSELFIFRSSGISEYDQECMRTIRASSPFAAPPQKFLEKDGLLRMSWTFTVYL